LVHTSAASPVGVNANDLSEVVAGHSLLQSNLGVHHDAPHAYLRK
jgi:hypothetical protein